MDKEELKKIIENLLFIAHKELKLEELEELIEVDSTLLEAAIQELENDYATRGLQIIKVAGGYQIGTRPNYSTYIDRFLSSPIETRLSQAAMETLAIIAYRQPITRIEIESIRGVMSDGVIKTLLDKSLIEEKGRGDGVGKPILYGSTSEFLRHFGLNDLRDLPALPQGEKEQADAFRMGMLLPFEELKQ